MLLQPGKVPIMLNVQLWSSWCYPSKTSVDIDALINWSYFRNGLQKSIYCLQSSQNSVSANFRLRKPRSKTRVWQLLAGVDIGHWSDNLWGRCQSWQSDGKYCWGLVRYLDIFNILIWNIWLSDGKHCCARRKALVGSCEWSSTRTLAAN